MNAAVSAAALACALLLAACAHEEGQRGVNAQQAWDNTNEASTSAAKDAGRAVRDAAEQTNEAVTDFFKGLSGED